MECNCPVCSGRDPNLYGIRLAREEVLPFLKKEILKMNFTKWPIPARYDGLTASIFAYSQALAYDRNHNSPAKKYYTGNKWMLRFASQLNKKFPELIITDISEVEQNENVKEVCEFNTSSSEIEYANLARSDK